MRYVGYFLLTFIAGVTMIILTLDSNLVFSSTSDNNTVIQQAQRSLEANQKKLPTVSPEPVPNVVPSTVQEIKGTSMVKGVFFTWVIISSDNEVSINLRYNDDGSTPPISIAATALTKSDTGKPVTMKGSTNFPAGWSSPSTANLELKGVSCLYDSTSIDVVVSPLGSSPPLPSTATVTVKPQTNLLMAAPPNADIWTRIQVTPHESFENYYLIPPDSSFNFKSGSPLCPVTPCEQEIFEGVLRKVSSFPNEYFFEGILKIIDKSVASNPEIKNWLYYPYAGEFLIKSTKENTKARSTVESFVGDLGFDRDKLHSGLGETHDIQYSIQGTFELPSKILTLVGKLK